MASPVSLRDLYWYYYNQQNSVDWRKVQSDWKRYHPPFVQDLLASTPAPSWNPGWLTPGYTAGDITRVFTQQQLDAAYDNWVDKTKNYATYDDLAKMSQWASDTQTNLSKSYGGIWDEVKPKFFGPVFSGVVQALPEAIKQQLPSQNLSGLNSFLSTNDSQTKFDSIYKNYYEELDRQERIAEVSSLLSRYDSVSAENLLEKYGSVDEAEKALVNFQKEEQAQLEAQRAAEQEAIRLEQERIAEEQRKLEEAKKYAEVSGETYASANGAAQELQAYIDEAKAAVEAAPDDYARQNAQEKLDGLLSEQQNIFQIRDEALAQYEAGQSSLEESTRLVEGLQSSIASREEAQRIQQEALQRREQQYQAQKMQRAEQIFAQRRAPRDITFDEIKPLGDGKMFAELKTNYGDFVYVPREFVSTGLREENKQFLDTAFLNKQYLNKTIPSIIAGDMLPESLKNAGYKAPEQGFLIKKEDYLNYSKSPESVASYDATGKYAGKVQGITVKRDGTPTYTFAGAGGSAYGFYDPQGGLYEYTPPPPPKKKRGIFGGGFLGNMMEQISGIPGVAEMMAFATGGNPYVYAAMKAAQIGGQGGDLKDVAKGAGLAYIGSQLPGQISKISPELASIPGAVSGLSSAGMSLISGSDLNTALKMGLSGGVSSGLSSVLQKNPALASIPGGVQAVSSTVGNIVGGKDLGSAITGGLGQGIGAATGSQVAQSTGSNLAGNLAGSALGTAITGGNISDALIGAGANAAAGAVTQDMAESANTTTKNPILSNLQKILSGELRQVAMGTDGQPIPVIRPVPTPKTISSGFDVSKATPLAQSPEYLRNYLAFASTGQQPGGLTQFLQQQTASQLNKPSLAFDPTKFKPVPKPGTAPATIDVSKLVPISAPTKVDVSTLTPVSYPAATTPT